MIAFICIYSTVMYNNMKLQYCTVQLAKVTVLYNQGVLYPAQKNIEA